MKSNTIYTILNDNIDENKLSYKFSKMKFKNNWIKFNFFIFMLYTGEKTEYSFRYLFETLQFDFGEIKHFMLQLSRIGVLDIDNTNRQIKLKSWDRRNKKIIPRNFIRQLQEIANIHDLEKEYDGIRYGLFRRFAAFLLR